MKELMQKILETRDKGLIDEVLREAGLVLKLFDGRLASYAGNSMIKLSNDCLEDLSIDSIESISVGIPPKVPTPVLSTEAMPNGKPFDVQDPTPSVDEETPSAGAKGIENTTKTASAKPQASAKPGGAPLFKV